MGKGAHCPSVAGLPPKIVHTEQPFGFSRILEMSRNCHGGRGNVRKNREQKVNREEKLTLALHCNLLILLGKLPLR